MGSLKSTLMNFPPVAALNSRVKAVAVERDAAAIQRRYQNSAGLIALDANSMRSAVRRRIDLRSQKSGWPKPLGELHIFNVFSIFNWEVVLPKSLAPFGEVSTFEWHSLGFDETSPDWLSHREEMNRQLLAAFDLAHARRPVDLVVAYVSGYTVAPEILVAMAARGAVIVNFCLDDKICWPGPVRGGHYTSTAALASAVDLNLTNDPQGPVRYLAHDGLAMFFPEAADPEDYRPLNLPFEYDVSFIGACFGWRPMLVRGLRRCGIEVACFGKGWPNGPVAGEEMKRIYAKSRINLGCGGIGYSKKLLCLKGRDFEVPMSGALYLTQDNPELALVFDVGEEILTYRDIDDCAETIRTLLGDEPRAAKIRLAARARSLRDHSYRVRWEEMLNVLGALEEPAADTIKAES